MFSLDSSLTCILEDYILVKSKLEKSKLDMLNLQKMQQSARNASELLKALGNEHRLMILCQLADGEKSVGQLVALIGIAQSPLSQHLARLRRDGLVRTRRQSQTIFYSLASAEATRVIELLYDMFCAQDGSAEMTSATDLEEID